MDGTAASRRGSHSGDVEPVWVEVAQDGELAAARRFGDREIVGHEQLEAGVVLDLSDRDAGVQGQHLHAPALVVEADDPEVGDDAIHAADHQTAIAPARAAPDEAGAGDEIDSVHKAPLLVLHGDDHVRKARDVVAAARTGKPRGRIVGIADEGAVQIAELIYLRAAHEPDVDVAALQ